MLPNRFYSGTIPASGSTDLPFGLVAGRQYFVEVNGVAYSAQAELNVEAVSLAGGPAIKDDEDDGQPEEPPVSPGDPPAGLGTFVVLRAGAVTVTSADSGQTGTMEGPAGTTVKFYDTDPRKATTAYVRGLGLIASRTNGVATYYHYDAHGNVVQLTDANGTVTKNYTYDAFGVEKGADDTDVNPFRYCGEQYDTETGNYYLRARYYTPGAGRFTQEDPAMDGLNWYAYCAGNPVAFVDPRGTDAILINKLVDNPASYAQVEHMSALFQDSDGSWYYFFWGDTVQNRKITDTSALNGLSELNKYLLDNQIIEREDRQYRDTVYIKGDFSLSISIANELVKTYENSPGYKQAIEKGEKFNNPEYDLLSKNCTQVTMALFFNGTLPSGMDVGEYVGLKGYGVEVVPNWNMSNMQKIFYNQSMTLSGFNSGIKEQEDKYEEMSPFMQWWSSGLKDDIYRLTGRKL